MAEEPQDPQSDEEADSGQPLDQDAINEMLQDTQSSEADNLENLLDDLEETPEEVEETSADAEGPPDTDGDVADEAETDTAQLEAAAEEDATEENTTENEASALDDLAAMFDEDEPDTDSAETPDVVEEATSDDPVEAVEAEVAESEEPPEEETFGDVEDLGSLLQGLDGDEPSTDEQEAANEEEVNLETLVDDEATTVEEMDDSLEEDLDLTDLVDSLDDDAGAAVGAEATDDVEAGEAGEELEVETVEGEADTESLEEAASDEDVAELLEDDSALSEVAEDAVEAEADDGAELVETLSDEEEEPSEDVESPSDDEEEVIDLGQVAQDTGEENLFDALVEDGEEDLSAEVTEDQAEDVEPEEISDEVIEEADLETLDVEELVDDGDDANRETLDVQELADDAAGADVETPDGEARADSGEAGLETLDVEESADDAAEADLETLDVEELGDDAAETDLETLDVEELADEGAEDLETLDLEELVDPETSSVDEEEDPGDLEDLIDGLDEEAEVITSQEEDEGDLSDLIDDLEDEESEDIEDLVGLVDETDEEEPEDQDSLLDNLDGESTEPEDDLDTLLAEEETEITVGVEDEVAHILATGEPPPDSDDSILDDFKSVQADLTADGGEDGGTILLVDANDETINLFRDALSDHDYGFVTAPSGEKALTAVQMHDVDLILVNLDWGDGEEIVSQLPGPDMPNIPVIVTSEETDRIETALQQGAVDHFTRPIGVLDLELQVPLTVANLVRLRRAERMLAGMPASEAVADEPETLVAAEDDLDSLLGEDPIFDEGDDEETLFDEDTSSSLDLDDLLDDDLEDSLEDSPEALLAGSGSSLDDDDRLTPLSDQGKMARRMDLYASAKSSAIPTFIGVVALVLALAGISGLATKYVMDMREAEMAPPEPTRPIALPVIKPPTIQQAGYERSRNEVRRPSDYERQADNVKLRIRNSVRELSDQNGAWWSPWRVMQSVGGSVDVLVQGRSRQDIVDAFGATRSDVDAALNSTRTVNYLERIGYEVRGKSASDLSARETFEVLSTREIDSSDEIVDVLSRLTDRLARDRADRAEREAKKRKSGTATLAPAPSLPKPCEDSTALLDRAASRTANGATNLPAQVRGSPSRSSG